MPCERLLVGVIPGEGIGPEVTSCAMGVLQRVADLYGRSLQWEEGGLIGRQSEAESGVALSDEVVGFCESIFDRGGAILNGPGGGRYVYNLRERLDLFFKISPLCSSIGLPESSRIKSEVVEDVDILVVRENSGGVYQGTWCEHSSQQPAAHTFQYSWEQVDRFLTPAARMAAERLGRLTVVWKESGVPTISQLWRECAVAAADRFGVQLSMVDVDLMAYRLIQEPTAFDVIAAPNLFGDILGDLGAVLLGSRGNSFSGNFNSHGSAVYQTNHGAAYDLAGSDRANPVGQILSMAMMLRESFGLEAEAEAVEEGVRQVWREGWRTADVATPRCRCIGTIEFAKLVADRASRVAERVIRQAA
jgi:3-isopropylmalate dehydrogenase